MIERRIRSLAHIVETYYHDLHRFIRRRTGSTRLADDVVQDTWIRATTTTVAMPQNAKAYVFRMAEHIAVDHLRRKRIRAEREAPGDIADPDSLATDTPAPDVVLAAHQELAILAAAIDELPTQRRRIFILYRGHGLTMRQIAERLGLSEKTVENQIARAMVHCRQRLRDAGRDI